MTIFRKTHSGSPTQSDLALHVGSLKTAGCSDGFVPRVRSGRGTSARALHGVELAKPERGQWNRRRVHPGPTRRRPPDNGRVQQQLRRYVESGSDCRPAVCSANTKAEVSSGALVANPPSPPPPPVVLWLRVLPCLLRLLRVSTCALPSRGVTLHVVTYLAVKPQKHQVVRVKN